MGSLKGYLAHPEYILEAPSSSNGFQWCWAVYDPLTSGDYYSGRCGSKDQAISEIKRAFHKLGITDG